MRNVAHRNGIMLEVKFLSHGHMKDTFTRNLLQWKCIANLKLINVMMLHVGISYNAQNTPSINIYIAAQFGHFDLNFEGQR